MEYIKKNIILVPIDFTDMVEYATGHAVGIAQSLHYEIILLHVINKETKSQVKKGTLSLDDVNQKLALIANDIVQNHKIKTSYIAREGSIFTTISEITKETGANMVIMATHGKVGVQNVVGSYAFKIIISSPAPVLFIQ